MTFGSIIFVDEGIVLSSAVAGKTIQPYVHQINELNAILLTDDLVIGLEFLQQHLKGSDVRSMDFAQLTSYIRSILPAFVMKYSGKSCVLVVVGYSNNFETQHVLGFNFDGTQLSEISLFPSTIFTTDTTIGTYFITKLYNRTISLEMTKTLISYIMLQYDILFRTGTHFDVSILSKNGFVKLTESEIKTLTDRAKSIDMDLKKEYSDIFLKKPADDGVLK